MNRHSASTYQNRNQHSFSLTPSIHIERSRFDRSHCHKTTFNEGFLIPILVDEVLPGDTHSCNLTSICRMATPIFPIMDNLYFETHFWFVPCRLVWDNWEQFNGQQANPADSTSFIIPVVTSAGTGFTSGSLADYFGIATLTPNALSVNSLPFRCYNLIYNEWYRDENLQNSLVVTTGNGPDTLANYSVRQRGKRHDYFTSCLPWPQKINDGTVVGIPLGTSAPLVLSANTNPTKIRVASTHGLVGAQNPLRADASGSLVDAAGTTPLLADVTTHTFADLSSATAATINQLRQAFQLQVLFERDARGGTRYTEIIRSHFGVISPDMRLQRPEYLGGGSTMININPVAQTAPGDVGGTGEQLSPQGTLSAFGVGHVNGHGFIKSFTEHGYIIGIASVRADLTYMQGVNRMWTRSTRYDFYWPTLAHIGEQAVSLGEIFAVGGAVTTDGWSTADAVVFGYQERYAEYRYKPSIVTGFFRANATGTLDAWHLAQNFSPAPALNSTFIVEAAPMSRVEAVTNVADFICDMFFNYSSTRPMPLYGTPMQLGRF